MILATNITVGANFFTPGCENSNEISRRRNVALICTSTGVTTLNRGVRVGAFNAFCPSLFIKGFTTFGDRNKVGSGE
eukprot:Pgem_evm1s11548